MNVIMIAVCTILAGFLGAAFLGGLVNWPDAGAVTAIAVMGAFIIWEMRKNARKKDEE